MLTSRKYVNNRNLGCHYIITNMDDDTLREVKSKFSVYQSKGVILNDSFNDNIWRLTNQISTFSIKFIVEKNLYQKNTEEWSGCSYQCFVDGIKTYAVAHLGKISIVKIQDIINKLCRIAETTYKEIKPDMHTVEFLKLLPDNEVKDQIIEDIEEKIFFLPHAKEKKRQRILAEFDSYFRFNDVLETFWKTASDAEKCFYFPIYLWWNLTAILPLRPTEFLLTPRDCLEKGNRENILTIRRTTLKGGDKQVCYNINDDYQLMKYCIPQALSYEIEKYISTTKEMKLSELGTLFVQEVHYQYLGQKSLRPNGYYSYQNLSACLKKFFKDVMNDDGFCVNLGDTRHLAMISLIVSGGTPVVCKELAGHSDINISSHYYSNISRFVECATYEMYQKKKGGYVDLWKHRSISTEKKIKVCGGYCDSAAYINGSISDCIRNVDTNGELGNCVVCPHFIDGKRGEYLIFLNSNERKKQVDSDSKYLMHVVEMVRKGKGCSEDIQTALMKLQHSSSQYSQCLYKNMEVL